MTEPKNLWGGRFTGKADPQFAEFNRSFGFDRRLFEADVRGSLAHCHGLLRGGVLSEAEAARIEKALHSILERQREANAVGDSDAFHRADETFHATIAEVAWALTYLAVGEAQPWIWLLPLIACVAALVTVAAPGSVRP